MAWLHDSEDFDFNYDIQTIVEEDFVTSSKIFLCQCQDKQEQL